MDVPTGVSNERNIDEMKGARISGYLQDVTWKNKYLKLERKQRIQDDSTVLTLSLIHI